MSEKLIKAHIVREVLKQLDEQFRTKVLSRHPKMIQAHPGLASHTHYHAFVGKYLSSYSDDVERIGESETSDGALWRNKLSGHRDQTD